MSLFQFLDDKLKLFKPIVQWIYGGGERVIDF